MDDPDGGYTWKDTDLKNSRRLLRTVMALGTQISDAKREYERQRQVAADEHKRQIDVLEAQKESVELRLKQSNLLLVTTAEEYQAGADLMDKYPETLEKQYKISHLVDHPLLKLRLAIPSDAGHIVPRGDEHERFRLQFKLKELE